MTNIILCGGSGTRLQMADIILMWRKRNSSLANQSYQCIVRTDDDFKRN